jgi:hypothetical protein
MARHEYTISELLRKQSAWCEKLGSPLYAYLLEKSALDFEAGGPARSILAGHELDPPESALALRFMGSVHHLVLTGSAPELAKYYPSAGGDADGTSVWPAFRRVLDEHEETLRSLVVRPVQTNEVGRCSALLPGFLEIARQTGLALRLLEIGASAGLNLRWDYYRYEYSAGSWGPVDSPVRIFDGRSSGDLPLDIAAKIVSRCGCDTHPVDPTTKEGQITLLSYVWADQKRRLDLLRGALKVAQNVPCDIDCCGAAEWIGRQLKNPERGVCTVLFHSIVWQYLGDRERDQVTQAIQRAGEGISPDARLGWLRMEPGGDQTEIWLQMWPRGRNSIIATAGYHGAGVRWLSG